MAKWYDVVKKTPDKKRVQSIDDNWIDYMRGGLDRRDEIVQKEEERRMNRNSLSVYADLYAERANYSPMEFERPYFKEDPMSFGDKTGSFLETGEIPSTIKPKLVYQNRSEIDPNSNFSNYQNYATNSVSAPIKVIGESGNYYFYRDGDRTFSVRKDLVSDTRQNTEDLQNKMIAERARNEQIQQNKNPYQKFIERTDENIRYASQGLGPQSQIDVGNGFGNVASDVLGTIGGMFAPIGGSAGSIAGLSNQLGQRVLNKSLQVAKRPNMINPTSFIGKAGKTVAEGAISGLPIAAYEIDAQNLSPVDAAKKAAMDVALGAAFDSVATGLKGLPGAIKKVPSAARKTKEAFTGGTFDNTLAAVQRNQSNIDNVAQNIDPAKPKQLHEMNGNEFDRFYELDQKLDNKKVERLIEDVGNRVINKYGTDDMKKILDIHIKKYNLPDNVTLSEGLRKNTKKGTTEPIRDENGNVIGAVIKINKNISPASKIGALRHEIEHYKDLIDGYEPIDSKYKIDPNKSTRENYGNAAKGEHKNYGWFEADYLRRAVIKDALEEGKQVPKEILDEFPDLANVTRVQTPAERLKEVNQKLSEFKPIEEFNKLKQEQIQLKGQKPKSTQIKTVQKQFTEPQKTFIPEPKPLNKNQTTINRLQDVISNPSKYTPEQVSSATKYKSELETMINRRPMGLNSQEADKFRRGQGMQISSYRNEIDKFLDTFQTKPVQQQIQPTVNQPASKTMTETSSEIAPSVKQTKQIEPKKKVSMSKRTYRLIEDGAEKERGFSKNVRTDLNMNDEIKNAFEKDPIIYRQLSNEKTLKSAQDRFNKGYDVALREFEQQTELKSDDIPLARMLANEAAKRGDIDKARSIIFKSAEKLTEAGRLSQAASILRRSNPAAFVEHLQRRIIKLNEDGAKIYGSKWKNIELSKDIEKEIYNLELFDEKGMSKMMKKSYDNINEQLPSTNLEKFDSWRRIAMLLNPKTHIRNLVGNMLMSANRKVADSIGAGLEKFIQKEQRTKSIGWSFDKKLKNTVQASWEEVKEDLISDGRYDIDSLKINNMDKQIFKTKWIEKLNNVSKDLLNKGDIIFLKRAYQDALGQIMKARGLKDVTEEAIEYASRRAKEATFRQANLIATTLNSLKRKPVIGTAVDVIVPFTKTPANILQTTIDYSPIGIVKAFTYDKLMKKSSAQVIESLAKGTTGSFSFLLGMYLAGLGLARGEASKSKNFEGIMSAEGTQANSIETPLGSYTFDWAQPFAVPMAMGIAFTESMDKKDKNPDDIIKAVSKMPVAALNSLINMSMLKNIKDFANENTGSIPEKIANLPIDYLEQSFPTLFGQVARSIDDTKRNTYGSDTIDKIINPIIAKTPIASTYLEPKLDVFGREQKQNSAPEQFLSPGYSLGKKDDKVTKEITSIYNKNKSTDVLPKIAKSFTSDGKPVILKPQEITQMQKQMGQANYKMIKQVIEVSGYQKLSSEEKEKAIAKIIRANYDEAKDNILEKRNMLKSDKQKKEESKQTKAESRKVNEVLDKILEKKKK